MVDKPGAQKFRSPITSTSSEESLVDCLFSPTASSNSSLGSTINLPSIDLESNVKAFNIQLNAPNAVPDSNNYFAPKNQHATLEPNGSPGSSQLITTAPGMENHMGSPVTSRHDYPTPSISPENRPVQHLRYDYLNHKPAQYPQTNIHPNISQNYQNDSMVSEEYQHNLFSHVNTQHSDPTVPETENSGNEKESRSSFNITNLSHIVNYEDDDGTEDDDLTEDATPSPKASRQLKGKSKAKSKSVQKASRLKSLISKNSNKNTPVKRWTESDDDKVAFLREYGNLRWFEVTELLNGRHTPQAVQMRYLRSLKRRNDQLTPEEREKFEKIVTEDYENRFKRIATQMGPSFTAVRIQKIFLKDAGLGKLLEQTKVLSREEIANLIGGDLDNFRVPTFADRLPPLAAEHMQKYACESYENLVGMYIGGPNDSWTCQESKVI